MYNIKHGVCGHAISLAPAGSSCQLCLQRLALLGSLLVGGPLDVAGQAQRLEEGDDLPGHVKLPLVQAMAGAVLKGVVVVVPALAKRQHSHPPVVAAQVSCLVGLQAQANSPSGSRLKL